MRSRLVHPTHPKLGEARHARPPHSVATPQGGVTFRSRRPGPRLPLVSRGGPISRCRCRGPGLPRWYVIARCITSGQVRLLWHDDQQQALSVRRGQGARRAWLPLPSGRRRGARRRDPLKRRASMGLRACRIHTLVYAHSDRVTQPGTHCMSRSTWHRASAPPSTPPVMREPGATPHASQLAHSSVNWKL